VFAAARWIRVRALVNHSLRVLMREGDPLASGFDPGGAGRELRVSFGSRRSTALYWTGF
jgi:hypothetical protein